FFVERLSDLLNRHFGATAFQANLVPRLELVRRFVTGGRHGFIPFDELVLHRLGRSYTLGANGTSSIPPDSGGVFGRKVFTTSRRLAFWGNPSSDRRVS